MSPVPGGPQSACFADPITRSDLELESRGAQASTVFGVFERPHTAAGAAELRAWLGTPLLEAREIRWAQRMIGDCHETVAAFATLVSRARPERVQRYLQSQLDVPRATGGLGGLFSSAWTAARHAECVAIAREGRECVSRLLAACREWCAHAAGMNESSSIRVRAKYLDECVRKIAAALESCSTSSIGLLKLDGMLRGDDRVWIEATLRELAQLDALHALAATVDQRGWTFPVVRDGAPRVVVQGLRHPLVGSPVENDVDLGDDHRVLLLTGPNMAGKTTYMKSVGIAVYLAHVGMAVPARAMELTPFDRLITVIGIHDSVAAGSSAFHYEVTRLGEALSLLLGGSRCLLLFDELMRGTNAADAQEACRLVIDALLSTGNCCAALSTHVAGLVDAVAGETRLTLGHFEAEMKDHSLAYDFRLRPGGYRGRMAMALLEQMGVTAQLARLRGESVAAGSGS